MNWIEESTGATGTSTRIEMYDFITSGNIAYVKDAQGDKVFLVARISIHGNKYIATHPDNTTRDNLLRLPECR